MDVFNNILLWLHLAALSAGGAAAFGMPVVGARIKTADEQTRPLLFSIAGGLSKVSRAALGVLIVTGPLMIWLKFGGMSGISWWFNLKMVLLVLLLGGVIYAGRLLKRMEAGDFGVGKRMPMVGAFNMVMLLGIVLSAVFAFN